MAAIVVTGASGFIGSNVVERLAACGRADVVAVDAYADPQARHRYLDALPVRAFVDRDGLFLWLEQHEREVQAVIHLGACSDTTVTDRAYVMRNNYEYTRALWNWCTRVGRPLLYASSAATYGDGSAGWDDESDPYRLLPLNLYGESKQRFDLWALEQSKAPPRWVGLKYFNVYGPHEKHKARMASVAFHAMHQIRAKEQVALFQSHRPDIPHGAQCRDFVCVADAVDATLHFLESPVSPAAPNGLYNVGTGAARSFEDLAKAVFAALHKPPSIEYVPMPEELREKYQYFTQATTIRLRRAGFTRPFQALEDGVRSYVQKELGLPA